MMYEYACEIVRVVDGDTVDVDIDLGFGVWMKKQRIRLYGVDTPESRTRDLVEKKYGFAAKAFVKSHLPKGSLQTLKTKLDGKGKFGRILGEFIVEVFDHDMGAADTRETTINKLLIENHHGVKYYGQSKEDIAEEHIENRELVNV